MTLQVESHATRLHFRTHYFVEDPLHESLAILGSLPVLGSWNSKKALLASRTEDNVWDADATVPSVTKFAWKWVVVEMNTGHVKRWEEREDRIFTANGQPHIFICAPWNEDHRFYTAEDFRKSPPSSNGTHYLNSAGALASGFINVGRNALKSLTPAALLSPSDQKPDDFGKKVTFSDEAADRIYYEEHGDDFDIVFIETPGTSHGPLDGHVDMSQLHRGILRHTSSTDAEPSATSQEDRIKDIKPELKELKSKKRRNSGGENEHDLEQPTYRRGHDTNGRKRREQRDDSLWNNETVTRYVLPSACVLSGIAVAYFFYMKLF